MVGKILEESSPTFGFNARTEEYVDLVAVGLMITTEAAIDEALTKNPGGGAPGGGMGDMDFSSTSSTGI